MKVIDNLNPLDMLAIVGLSVLAAGVAMLSVPAAFIVVGGAFLVYAVLASRAEVPK